jgi:hypothetical protein
MALRHGFTEILNKGSTMVSVFVTKPRNIVLNQEMALTFVKGISLRLGCFSSLSRDDALHVRIDFHKYLKRQVVMFVLKRRKLVTKNKYQQLVFYGP